MDVFKEAKDERGYSVERFFNGCEFALQELVGGITSQRNRLIKELTDTLVKTDKQDVIEIINGELASIGPDYVGMQHFEAKTPKGRVSYNDLEIANRALSDARLIAKTRELLKQSKKARKKIETLEGGRPQVNNNIPFNEFLNDEGRKKLDNVLAELRDAKKPKDCFRVLIALEKCEWLGVDLIGVDLTRKDGARKPEAVLLKKVHKALMEIPCKIGDVSGLGKGLKNIRDKMLKPRSAEKLEIELITERLKK
ncbi:MAG: hypothetical protein HYZ16_01430 [Bacteroidetes bacterium]|nr:hypothetical protein [Bacteroidota bacterium]